MSRTPPQLLADIVLEAARTTLNSPAYAGQGLDPAAFARSNHAKMLDLVAAFSPLRTELRQRWADTLAGTHPLLQALLGEEAGASRAAAAELRSPKALRPPGKTRRDRGPVAAVDGASPGGTPANATITAVRRFEKRLAEAREGRDTARAQRDQARAEASALRRSLDAAESDRDEADAVAEALRAELDAERVAAAAQARDLHAAAALLRTALLPAPAGDADDPRTAELADADRSLREYAAGVQTPLSAVGTSPVTDRAATAGRPSDPQAAAALELTSADPGPLLALLDALLAQPARVDAMWAGEPREIALTPLGGGTDIGGSCMLVTVGDVRILVDAGMRPKKRIDQAGPEGIDIARAGRIDAVIITHAHNDHAGYVPALTADYPNMEVLCTPDTAALLPTMWNDSVKVFARTRNDHVEPDEPPAEPPYTGVQVSAALRRMREVQFGRVVEIADGVTIELFPAGHILGAAGVVVTAGENRVTVTGDVSTLAQATVPGLVVPDAARGSDLLVIESTYCGHQSANREAEVEKFVRLVGETVSSGGRVLVPAFALGRAQEVALTLRNRLPDVDVLIDGMARAITDVYERQTADTPRQLEILGDRVRKIRDDEREQLLRTFRKGVIVTTSGMLTSGPAVRWARSILPDADAALLLAGYQDEESPGAELLDLASSRSGGTFTLDTDEVQVRSQVQTFSLSAHADRRGLSAIITEVDPGAVMLVHGVKSKQRDFAENLRGRRIAVVDTRHWQL